MTNGDLAFLGLSHNPFVLTGDVTRCFQRADLDITDTPGSKRELKLVQEIFNQWHEESGLPYSHISRVCACSL